MRASSNSRRRRGSVMTCAGDPAFMREEVRRIARAALAEKSARDAHYQPRQRRCHGRSSGGHRDATPRETWSRCNRGAVRIMAAQVITTHNLCRDVLIPQSCLDFRGERRCTRNSDRRVDHNVGVNRRVGDHSIGDGAASPSHDGRGRSHRRRRSVRHRRDHPARIPPVGRVTTSWRHT